MGGAGAQEFIHSVNQSSVFIQHLLCARSRLCPCDALVISTDMLSARWHCWSLRCLEVKSLKRLTLIK